MTDTDAPAVDDSPAPSRRFLVRPLWLIGGLIWGAALFILLQQYAVFVYSNGTLAAFTLAGLVLGLLMPNLAALIAEKRQSTSENEGGAQ